MRSIPLFLSVILIACTDGSRSSRNLQLQEERITRLEERLDSLMGARVRDQTVTPVQTFLPTTGSEQASNRCLAKTKKGTQCKRKAKSGGFCWQHGG